MKLVMRAFCADFGQVSEYHVEQAWQTNGKQHSMLLFSTASPESAASAVRDGNVDKRGSPEAHTITSGEGKQHKQWDDRESPLGAKLGYPKALT